MRRSRRARTAALVVALAWAVTACGGDTTSDYTAVRNGSSDRSPATDRDRPSDPSGPGTDVTTDDSSAPASAPSTEATNPDDTGAGTAPPPGTNPSGGASFGFEECSGGAQCGHLEVPLDYDDPSSGSIDLYVTRHPAAKPDERIGSLLVNPGGPGFGGSDFALFAEQIYGQPILDRFDIIGWDPRGTGESEPAVDCVDSYDEFFGLDVPPKDDAARQAVIDAGKRFGEECEKKNADLLPFVSTEFSARDMNSIRDALGEDTISYFGFSYGSELGATWATLFPDTVRAAVLDGAADPNAGYIEGGLQQAKGFEASFDTFLAQCSDNASCAFNNGGDAASAYDSLEAAIAEKPLSVRRDRVAVNRGVLSTAIANAMYSQSLWPQLEQALADAQNGDGAGVLDLFDDYYQRNPDGTYGNELEAFLAISCLDDPGPRTAEEVDSHVAEFEAAAPRLGDSFAYGYVCTFWPVEPAGKVTITGRGAGPIVVVGTTGDPATPLDGTRNMATTLEDGVLVVVEADQHTGYRVNSCVDDAVENYLVDLVVPQNELRCA